MKKLLNELLRLSGRTIWVRFRWSVHRDIIFMWRLSWLQGKRKLFSFQTSEETFTLSSLWAGRKWRAELCRPRHLRAPGDLLRGRELRGEVRRQRPVRGRPGWEILLSQQPAAVCLQLRGLSGQHTGMRREIWLSGRVWWAPGLW